MTAGQRLKMYGTTLSPWNIGGGETGVTARYYTDLGDNAHFQSCEIKTRTILKAYCRLLHLFSLVSQPQVVHVKAPASTARRNEKRQGQAFHSHTLLDGDLILDVYTEPWNARQNWTMKATNAKKIKVRTGCITCKIRKIKCDESKPDCTRCTSTGRKCDGYVKLNHASSKKRPNFVLNKPNQNFGGRDFLYRTIRAPPSIASASERRWLEYFNQHAGPALCDLVDQDFWANILPRLSISELAIRHALLAVGSAYARFEALSKKANATSVIEHNHSVKHYSLAVATLQRRLLQTPGDAIVPLICCLLFICLECLYGNQPLMLDHLSNGLRILSSGQLNNTHSATLHSITQKLGQIFGRLDTQSTLYGKPALLPSGDPDLAFNLAIPQSFEDLSQAKMYLDKINSMSLSFIRLAKNGVLFEKYQSHSVVMLQRQLQEQFMVWRNAIDRYDHVMSPVDVDDKDKVSRLRIEYNASFIYLGTCLEIEETSYDAYSLQFAAIVSLAQELPPYRDESTVSKFMSSSTDPSTNKVFVRSTGFSLEASLIPSLYLTAIKCRVPTIRRDAVSLLQRNNGREGLWDAKINWCLARRIVEIEEQGMMMYQGAAEAFMEAAPSMRMQASNGAVLTDLPDERFRVTSGDIVRNFDEEPRSPIRVTFYTRPHGVLEQEHAWEEDLWF